MGSRSFFAYPTSSTLAWAAAAHLDDEHDAQEPEVEDHRVQRERQHRAHRAEGPVEPVAHQRGGQRGQS